MMSAVPFSSLTMPPMYGNSRPDSSADRSGARLLVEKTTCMSREAKVCGILFRPYPGLPEIRADPHGLRRTFSRPSGFPLF
jgi:hypothetical protein